eukprot:15301390-Heterocapsa_arctica.AAC.1
MRRLEGLRGACDPEHGAYRARATRVSPAQASPVNSLCQRLVPVVTATAMATYWHRIRRRMRAK